MKTSYRNISQCAILSVCCLFNSSFLFSQVETPLEEPANVVGGVIADPSAYPWVAQLTTDGGSPVCGGSLIAPNWVLTAGHCALGPTLPTKVRLNPHKTLSPQASTEIIDIEQMYVFPGYTINNNEYVPDICLLKLSSYAQSHDAIPFMSDASDLGLIEAGDWCKVLGWGSTNLMGAQSNTMKEGEMEIIGSAFCSTAYSGIGATNYDQDSTICAGYLTGQNEVGAGAGDSGGPLFVLKNGDPLLVGVVSGGFLPITTADYPGIYTKVYTVRDWIQNTINLTATMNEVMTGHVQIYCTGNEIIIDSKMQSSDEMKMAIYDAQGKMVHAATFQLELGVMQLALDQTLVNGIYYVTVSSTDVHLNQKIGVFR